MSVWEFLTAPQMTLFTAALGLVLALLMLELAALALGGSLFGADGSGDAELDADVDAGGAELDADADVDLAAAPTIGAPLGANLSASVLADALADIDAGPDAASVGHGAAVAAPEGLIGWLGFGKTPFLVWLLAFLTSFGGAGYLLQLLHRELLGGLGPAVLVALIALPLGLVAAARFATGFARLLPKVQTTAVRRDSLSGRPGVVTGGLAEAGRPAEARVRDVHGGVHYIRVEPFSEGVRLAEGTEIVVLKVRGQGDVFRGLSLEEARRVVADARAERGADVGERGEV